MCCKNPQSVHFLRPNPSIHEPIPPPHLSLFLCSLIAKFIVNPPASQQVKSSDIWNEEEIPEGGHGEDEHDPRPAPE